MMKAILKRVVGPLFLAVVCLGAWAGEGSWLTDFEAAKKKAVEKKLHILVDFSGSDWCGWCIRLEQEVFSKKEFKDYADKNLVLFLADFPRGKELPEKTVEQNRELAAKYGVQGFPTVLLLGADGKLLARTGYQEGGAEAYVKHLKELLAGDKPGG